MQPIKGEKLKVLQGHNNRNNGFLDGWEGISVLGENNIEEQYLSKADPRLGIVISRVTDVSGPKRYKLSNASSHFDAIARSIIYQQLSKKAAATIYNRYIDILRGAAEPTELNIVEADKLRSAGLSAPKIRYLKALASAVTSGSLDLEKIAELPDNEIMSILTNIPGIGIWTAQMFLMFRLQRPDILPTNDVGIQRGLQIAHGLRKPASPGYITRAGKKWAPYRSIASLYLWAAVDLRIDQVTI